MTRRLALIPAFLLASCGLFRPAAGPLPLPAPPAPPAPVPAAPPEHHSAPPPAPTPQRAAADSLADSLALARLARDSALDQAMLDRIATAAAPEANGAVAPLKTDEAATLRGMFDIDVANWVDHNRVRFWTDFFVGAARERMAIWLTRMPHYEPTMREALVAHGLPGDLAYLPLIESGYSPTAVSRSRAVGMWQFMKGTARLYGLHVDGWVDERRDVAKATDAAVRYLADLTAQFGSPYLALAAYNGGPGRISRGLARIDVSPDEPVDAAADAPGDGSPQAGDMAFFQLADTRYLRRETKDYVPKLIAAAMIAKQPHRYGFPPVEPATAGPLDSVVVTDATGLDVIARLAGVTLADLWELNPIYVRALTPPARTSVVRVPAGVGAAVQRNLAALPARERLTSFPHKVKAGETSARIARRYGLTVAELRALNPELRAKGPVPGQAVRIPGQARIKGWLAEDRRSAAAELKARTRRSHRAAPPRAGAPGRPRLHVVRAGETLSSLARRFGVSVQALRSANGLPAGRPLVAGKRLTIPS